MFAIFVPDSVKLVITRFKEIVFLISLYSVLTIRLFLDNESLFSDLSLVIQIASSSFDELDY